MGSNATTTPIPPTQSPSSTSVATNLQTQFRSPNDILSLLLILGGDVIQKTIAQLHGRTILTLPGSRNVSFTPVAFSFGWVAFAYATLVSAVGEGKLMPQSDTPSIVVNCANGYVRNNQNWALGRVLRDHEVYNEVDPSEVSIRIDIFDVLKERRPGLDWVWWSGIATSVLQIGLFGIGGWAVWGDWSVLMITLAGTALAIFTASLPQWHVEKFPERSLSAGMSKKTTGLAPSVKAAESAITPVPELRPAQRKTVALTRGNGAHHVMILRSEPGARDMESLAFTVSKRFPETKLVLVLLIILWTLLLLCIPALDSHSWLLFGVGALGMIQNTYAAGAIRSADAFGIHLKRPVNSVIEARRQIPDPKDRLTKEQDHVFDKRLIPSPSGIVKGGVMDALVELGLRDPAASVALLDVFFPSGLMYKGEKFRNNVSGNQDRQVFAELLRRAGRPVSEKVLLDSFAQVPSTWQ